MKQTSNPVNSLLNIVLLGILSLGIMAYFIKVGSTSKTPMDRHVEYILEKHNDSCHYEMGECPQFECSHYGEPVTANKIMKQTTDDRGLISVVYHVNGENLALDYLTQHEYDSLVNVLNRPK